MKAPAVNAPVTKALDIASLNSVIIYSQMLKFLLLTMVDIHQSENRKKK